MNSGYAAHFNKMKKKAKPKAKHASKRAKTAHRRRKTKRFPIEAVFGFVICGILVVVSLFPPEQIEDWLDRLEVRFLPQSLAADAAKTTATKAKAPENSAAMKAKSESPPTAQTATVSPQELSHFKNLRMRKEQLDLRETELNELEEELQKQKTQIEERIANLEQVRRQIAGILQERVAIDDKKIGKLVDFYSNMKPKQAAQILGTINEDLAVEVLGRMKKKNAAAIMNLLKPDKAQVLSEKFAGYQRR